MRPGAAMAMGAGGGAVAGAGGTVLYDQYQNGGGATGYYDESGQWVVYEQSQGYYDESGSWVAYTEETTVVDSGGYGAENGQYGESSLSRVLFF